MALIESKDLQKLQDTVEIINDSGDKAQFLMYHHRNAGDKAAANRFEEIAGELYATAHKAAELVQKLS